MPEESSDQPVGMGIAKVAPVGSMLAAEVNVNFWVQSFTLPEMLGGLVPEFFCDSTTPTIVPMMVPTAVITPRAVVILQQVDQLPSSFLHAAQQVEACS